MKYLIAALLLTHSMVYAGTCKRVVDCVKEATEVTGIKYLYSAKMFDAKDELNTEMNLTKENADVVLSEVLSMFDYMKLPTKVENTWEIIPGRDIRYHADLPTFKASKKLIPTLPNNNDPIHLVYQAQVGTEVGDIARNLRPFLSRYGRIIDMKGGIIILIDRASNIDQCLPIIQAADMPLTKEEKLAREKADSRHHERELARIKSGMHSDRGPGPEMKGVQPHHPKKD